MKKKKLLKKLRQQNVKFYFKKGKIWNRRNGSKDNLRKKRKKVKANSLDRMNGSLHWARNIWGIDSHVFSIGLFTILALQYWLHYHNCVNVVWGVKFPVLNWRKSTEEFIIYGKEDKCCKTWQWNNHSKININQELSTEVGSREI